MTNPLPISTLPVDGSDESSVDEDEFGPDRRGHKGATRQCLVSGERLDKSELVRFVRAPDDSVVPDILEKLPGRGVWVRANRETLSTAVQKKAFARGFKSKVTTPPDLVETVTFLLSRRVLGLLTMAHKAGHLALGFDQVKSVAQSTRLAFRIEASDGSEDGRGKIRVLSKAVSHEMDAAMTPVIGCYSMAELGEALGRERIVHAALKPGGFSKSLKGDVARLSGFMDMVPDHWPDKAHEALQKKHRESGD